MYYSNVGCYVIIDLKVVLCVAVLIGRALCGDGTIGQFPPGPISNTVGSVANVSVDVIGACGQPKKSDYSLLLYTKSNPFNPIRLTDDNLSNILPSRKKTVVIIHGYFSSSKSFTFPNLKDAYLIRYDGNIIMLDWSSLSRPRLSTASCFLPKLAPLVADTLCRLNMSLARVHLVGHSLGAQMSGMIGSNTMALCRRKVGRITAMDPGGPLYPEFPESQRLDKSDASFVDVIHTNAGGIGFWGNTGHVDFYVNCGSSQPGCPTADVRLVEDLPPTIVFCAHLRSVEYMTESIISNKFVAKPCPTCPLPCFPNLLANVEAVMGEDCPRNVSGAYVLFTNSEAPFGKGRN